MLWIREVIVDGRFLSVQRKMHIVFSDFVLKFITSHANINFFYY